MVYIYILTAILQTNHCVNGLEYSTPLSDEDIFEDASDVVLLYTPFLKLFESSSGFLRGSGAAALWPSSASLFRMFITVGRNFVDKDRRPGSCTIMQASTLNQN